VLSLPSEAREASVSEIHNAVSAARRPRGRLRRANLAAIGSVYFAFSLSRFRRIIFGG
jgi:hypothetical protein